MSTRLAHFVERMMRDDVAPSLTPPSDLDVGAYIGEVLARFRNPAIAYNLSQIAGDGSQKLPFRLLATIQDLLAADRPVVRPTAGVAAWMHYVRRQTLAGGKIVDPRFLEALTNAYQALTGPVPSAVLDL
jgi:fructuronate reductase